MRRIGSTVGNIRIVSVLGAGGMGTVYDGFDVKLQREVAVKAIRSDCLTAASRARFLREARALSRLDHPNICAIHGFLETEEGDFLVLERLHGRPLPQAALDLSFTIRLDVAEQVAQALVAAHAAGIVHRDLKLDNVFLTADGTAKVLDFGVAQLEEQAAALPLPPSAAPRAGGRPAGEATVALDLLEDPDVTFHTQSGVVVGTARSMSPEQARGEPVTPASDMFSFGLLLQELLTGRPAYDRDLPTAALLAKVARGETRPASGLSPGLSALLERLKSPAPEARPTASEALGRLRRIRDRPRRRLRAAAAALAVLALGLAAAKYTLDLKRERDAALTARRDADRSRQEAERVASFLVDLFRVSDPGEARGNSITAREILDRGAERTSHGLEGQPLVRARLLDTIGQTFLKLGLYGRARLLLEQALALRERELGQDHLDVALSLQHLGMVYQAEHRDAEPLFTRALAIEERQLGPVHPDVATTLNSLGTLHGYHGEMAKARPLFARALAIREATLGPNHPDVAASLNNLAMVEAQLDHPEIALPLLKRGLAIREAALPADHPDLAANLEALALVYDDQQRLTEAEALHRRALAIWEKALGPEHPKIALVLSNLAASCLAQQRGQEAAALYQRAIALREKALGPPIPIWRSCSAA